jgi:hypothetical protein
LAVYLQRLKDSRGDCTLGAEVLDKMRELATPEALWVQLAVKAEALRAAKFTAEEVERQRRWGTPIRLVDGAPDQFGCRSTSS